MTQATLTPSRPQVLGADEERFDEILTPGALEFVARLDSAFAERRTQLLAQRRQRAELLAAGGSLDFLPRTAPVRRDDSWRVAPAAPGLTDRRVEITGPPERRMAINALNSGARVWMADFEDATSPTWHNVISGQLTLLDAIERRIDFTAENGKEYRLTDYPATIVVRPRGWHLTEKHLLVDGRPMSASLVDFGLYFYHCAQRQIDAGQGPYFYLPKLENHLEARLWNDVFLLAQELLDIPRGTVRATVLIETLTAAFEMEEILYELREHSSGLNAGRWDYLFSLIKNFAHRPDFVLPDRAKVTMTAPFMRAYTELLVRTCHKRGAHAIGGMAAQVPSRDQAANEAALAKVRLDKEREAEDGFDGSWVAHPALVPVCREVFDQVLGEHPHQLERTRDEVSVTSADLLAVHKVAGGPTEEGLRANIAVALRYYDAWLRGRGAVALYGLMEDAATAEIARCQVWQWLRHQVVDRDTVGKLLEDETLALGKEDPDSRAEDANRLFTRTALGIDLPLFFTTDSYARHLVTRRPG
ncbi:malate synthase A [Streptomyces sp. NPDC005438]|uniref:malate synthase A n=1 Tax=Streptomyces sp. NPDC005438 TaxID=3156880 RepID=UPI0033BCC8ED